MTTTGSYGPTQASYGPVVPTSSSSYTQQLPPHYIRELHISTKKYDSRSAYESGSPSFSANTVLKYHLPYNEYGTPASGQESTSLRYSTGQKGNVMIDYNNSFSGASNYRANTASVGSYSLQTPQYYPTSYGQSYPSYQYAAPKYTANNYLQPKNYNTYAPTYTANNYLQPKTYNHYAPTYTANNYLQPKTYNHYAPTYSANNYLQPSSYGSYAPTYSANNYLNQYHGYGY